LTSAGVDSWYHEKESAWLYRQVAAAEADPAKSALFLKLAAAAEEQAAKWQLAAQRDTPGTPEARRFVPSLRARIVARLLSRFEPRSLRSVLAAMKLRGLSIYSAPLAVAGHAMPPHSPRWARVIAVRSAAGCVPRCSGLTTAWCPT